jgi:hypothetical protein
MRSTILRFLVLGSILVGLVAACTPADPVPTEGTVSIRVVDALSGGVLDGITIQVRPSGGSFTTPQATVQGDGSYTFDLTAATGYTITLARTGYLTATYNNVAVVGGQTTFLAQLLLIDSTAGTEGDASGIITDAFDGIALPGATVRLREQVNTFSGTPIETTTTDANGAYAFADLAAGYYTAEVALTGYIPSFFTLIVVGGEANGGQNFSIAPVGSGDLLRIVLTWGLNPDDLDSHLTGPAVGGGRFHVNYFDDVYEVGGVPYVALDVDDTDSYGPETISIYEQIAGTYRYSVHDYTNALESSSTALANSGAQVRVFRGANLAATFNVPAGAGTLWTVFELSGTAIVPINTMSYQSDEFAITALGGAELTAK